MPSDAALYYPSFVIEDSEFLLSQALYWEHIYRLKPRGFKTPDSTVAKALSEAGVLRDLDPGRYAAAASAQFRDFLEGCPERLKSRVRGERSGYIARIKMDDRLEELLVHQGYAETAGPWLRTSNAIGRYYMFYLTNFVSRENRLNPITDDHQSWAALSYFHEGGTLAPSPSHDAECGHPQDGRTLSHYLLALMLTEIAPVNIGQVKLDKILMFREKRRSERLRYLSLLDTIITGAQEIGDPKAITGYFETQGKNIQSVLTELKRSFRDISIASVLNVKSVSVPILAAAIGSMAHRTPWLYITPAVGLAVGIAGSIHETRTKKRERLASSPYSYLYFVGREITAHPPHFWSRKLDTKAFEWIVTSEWSSSAPPSTDRYPLARTLDHAIGDFLYD